MRELLRTRDPVYLSWVRARLSEIGIEPLVIDASVNVLGGILPRQVMVSDQDLERAREAIADPPNLEVDEDLA